jgi:hypothetical protein
MVIHPSAAPDNRMVPYNEMASAPAITPHGRIKRNLVSLSVKPPRLVGAGIQVDSKYFSAPIWTTQYKRSQPTTSNQYAITWLLQERISLVSPFNDTTVANTPGDHELRL